jgi:hypothetical protein
MGVISWGGDKCGPDGLPNVYADVVPARSWILDPSPAWAPTTTRPVRISGAKRAGGTLTCETGGFAVRPGAIRYAWRLQGAAGAPVVGRARTLRVGRGLAGRRVTCFAFPEGDGGRTAVPLDAKSIVRIAR